MQINTKFFGQIDIDEQELFLFEHGLPGFEDKHRFYLAKYQPELPFYILQSIEEPGLAFILIGLEQVVPGYSIELTDEAVAALKINQPEEAVVYAIVNIPGEMEKATVNLAAPLVLNTHARLGKQIILNNPSYSMRHPLFSNEPVPVKAAKEA